MKEEFDKKLNDDFLDLLDSEQPDGKKKELIVHEFLEKNTVLIPTPNLLNHHLHFEVIVSKFPLDTSLETDYVYITKSSDTWRVTLVELEKPEKKMFTNNQKQVDTSSDFNKAIGQVRSWQVFIEENKNEVIRRLSPLFYPIQMRSNPIEFDYQLIYGRSEEKNNSPERIKVLNRLRAETSIDIMTYDTLLNYYKNTERYVKNVLALSKNQMRIKHLHNHETALFSYLTKDDLLLTGSQKEIFKSHGYEIEEWEKGKPLSVNRKITMETYTKNIEKFGLSGAMGL
ncbi:DUF4263 domain-containing protein [Vibrio parahaemolyticus]|uniref:Shedu immune nuclease family protein n=1 Tax=Vibrio parahaemolyticus TaxID=670 RepID=UPI0003FC69A6|nr:Shedu immune nuclease family protein [Vibrio parahaemolyticus]EJC7971397.1 DUF4263 domain-containing protein [Vibrio parahaemolyticus]MDF4341061.1 DUF4263 domain-containing protein [Vibrio parahaemolyticus]MDF4932114.1 DUF4263 domain-containing protein [Vibrio parahaemolyticus]